jgi:hypothetical protein
MNLHNINRRLHRLDATIPSEPRRVILMQRDDGETFEAAVERWYAQNPDQPPPDDKTDFIILRSIVAAHPVNGPRNR